MSSRSTQGQSVPKCDFYLNTQRLNGHSLNLLNLWNPKKIELESQMSPRVGSRKETDAINDESPIQLLLGTNAAASLISSGCKKLQNKRLTKRILSPAAVQLRIPKAYSVSKQLYSRLRTKGNDSMRQFSFENNCTWILSSRSVLELDA